MILSQFSRGSFSFLLPVLAISVLQPVFGQDSKEKLNPVKVFILSGQSNMQGHRPEEAFNPAVEKALGKDKIIVMCLSGRGDKDIFTVAEALGVEL